MGDINRFLILLILVGLIFALYKYQDTILENLDTYTSSLLYTPTMVPEQIPQQIQQTEGPKLIKNKEPEKISADNISQISISSLNGKGGFDINTLSNSDNISIILDDNTCDSRVSKQTYGSLFDD
jgi:hypothetical protein